jgi:alpha,alpha-trehalose phosphorylase
LRIDDGRLAFDPTLPPAWRGYRVGIAWKGRMITLQVSALPDATGPLRGGRASYTLTDGMPIEIEHAGKRVLLRPGAPLVLELIPRAAGPVRPARGGFPQPFKAVIFDLDGVLADTAHLHHAAWRRLASEIGIAFDESIGERLKGVDRAASLEIVLGASASAYTQEQKHELAERKNGYYRASIAQFGPQDLLPGARRTLLEARAAGLKIGLASASRSARDLVRQLGVAEFFDHVADAALVSRPKPNPDIFLDVAYALGVSPDDCLGVEDAAAGIAAIKSAGMTALGIGDPSVLLAADAVLPNLAAFDLVDFVSPRS